MTLCLVTFMATLRQIFIIATIDYGVSLLNDVFILVQVRPKLLVEQKHEEINKGVCFSSDLRCFIKVFSVSILYKVRKRA